MYMYFAYAKLEDLKRVFRSSQLSKRIGLFEQKINNGIHLEHSFKHFRIFDIQIIVLVLNRLIFLLSIATVNGIFVGRRIFYLDFQSIDIY